MSLTSATVWQNGGSIQLLFSGLVAAWNGTNPTATVNGVARAVTNTWFWNQLGTKAGGQNARVVLTLASPCVHGDTVTVSYGAGTFTLGTALPGTSEAAVTNFACIDHVNVNALALPNDTRTTLHGWNEPGHRVFYPGNLHANMAKIGTGWGGTGLVTDANGDFVSVTSGVGSYTAWTLNTPATGVAPGVTYEGVANTLIPYVMFDDEFGPTGALIQIYWDGASNGVAPVSQNGNSFTPTGTNATGQAADNHRSYFLKSGAAGVAGNFSNLVLQTDNGTGAVTNLRVYGPGSNPGDHFNAPHLAQLGQRPAVIRYMEDSYINNNPKYLDSHQVNSSYVQFNSTPTDNTFVAYTPSANVTSASDAATHSDPYFNTAGGWQFDLNCPSHGFPPASSTVPAMQFFSTSGTWAFTVTGITYLDTAGATQTQPDTVATFQGGFLGRVVDANTIRLAHTWKDKPAAIPGVQLAAKTILTYTLSPTAAPAGTTVSASYRPGDPPEEQVALTKLFAGCSHWANVPTLYQDGAFGQYMNRVIYGNPAGTGSVVFPTNTDFILEYSNEQWNAGAFFHNAYTLGMGQTDATVSALAPTIDRAYGYYVLRGHQLRALARAAFAAAGLDPNRVVWAVNVQASSGGGDTMFKAAQALGVDTDIGAVAFAPYFNPILDGSYAAAFASVTPDQAHDIAQAAILGNTKVGDGATNLTYFGAKTFGAHKYDGTEAGKQNVRLYCYEWAVESLRPQTGASAGADAVSRRAAAHPRMADLIQYRLYQLQGQGVERACYFESFASNAGKWGISDAEWAAWQGLSQVAGVGDASDGKNNNLLDLENPRGRVSTKAYGLQKWKAAELGAPPVTRVFSVLVNAAARRVWSLAFSAAS